MIRKINNWAADETGGYEVFVKDYHQMDSISNRLIDKLPAEWMSKTIREVYPNIFDWLNIQDTNQNILITIMTIIAIINLITCLIILVLERLRMVGVLKALGATNWTDQKLFLNHSVFITLTGIIIGCLVGLGL